MRPRVWSAELSLKNLRSDARKVAKASSVAWSVAKKAPLFQRAPKSGSSSKPRLRRCIRRAVFKTMLSGAAAEATALLKEESERLGVEFSGEATVSPALPTLSAGAELAIEHVVCSYASLLFDTAVRLKSSLGVHSKVTVGAAQAAAAIVNRELASAVAVAPGITVPEKTLKRKRRAKPAGEKTEKKDADIVEEAEEAEEEADSDA